MRSSTKSASIQNVYVSPETGLDLSGPPETIQETSLTRALNIAYPADSSLPVSRYGVEPVTTEGNKLSGKILRMHKFYNGSTTYLMAACSDQKLYYMTKSTLEGGSASWSEVGVTDSTIQIPAMLTFNSKLMFGGGGRIRTWDGSTYSSLTGTGAPTISTALTEAKGRLVSNDGATGLLDAVKFSASNDETDFDPASSGLLIRAGYKDGMNVNALDVFFDSMVVSKLGEDGGVRKFFKISMADSTPSNWSADDLVNEYAAKNAGSLIRVGDDVIFGDDSGLHGLKGTDAYGDISYNPFGNKINNLVKYNNLTVNDLCYSPLLHGMIVLFDSVANMLLWFPGGGWTQWNLSGAIVTSCCEIDGTLYFGTYDGRLLKYKSSGGAVDEVESGVTSNFETILRSKKISAAGRALQAKRMNVNIYPLASGSGVLELVKNDDTTTRTMKTFAVDDGVTLIGEADELIGESAGLVGDEGNEPTNVSSRQRVRDYGLYLQLRLTSGARAKINSFSGEFAAPVGR